VARVPVGPLDPVPADRAKPGIGDELVRAREHADRVELDRAEPAQHGRHPAAAGAGADEALRAQRDEPHLVGRQRQLSCRCE
jgi:hypothetical protein